MTTTQNSITKQSVQAFLKKQKLAVLSTVTRNGLPDAAPVYFLLERDFTFLIVSNKTSNKNQNIAHQKRVVLTVTDREQKATIQVFGIAEMQKSFSVVSSTLDKLAARLNDEDNFETALPPLEHKNQNLVVIHIRPVWIRMRKYSGEGVEEKTITF